ncbi:MAG: Ig-like domain-containing protein [Ignavibacteriales bacterium]|nr:Ig-like domain-containing protein [Ignavibacteriales bacterium]
MKKKAVVTISSPLAGSLITGPVLVVAATALEDSIVAVDFLVDSQSIGRDTTAPSFSRIWQVGFWADGLEHYLKVIAKDIDGDTAHSQPVVVTVSAEAQAVGLMHPIPNQIIQGPFSIDLLIPEDIVLVSAEFLLDGLTLARDTTAPFEQLWNPAFWADGGSHTIAANVEDSSGRKGKAGPVTVTVPTTVSGYPVPLSPVNRLVIDDLQQMFLWSLSPTAVTYEIEISPLQDYNPSEHTSIVVDTTYTTTLSERSIYFWRIRATNSFQRYTAWHEAEFASTPTFRIIRADAGLDQARSADVTSDGGYVLTGTSEYDGLRVIKTDRFGVEQWVRNFGVPYDVGFSIRQSSDGGFILGGRMESSTEGRFVLLKLTFQGNQSWLKRFGRQWDEGALSVVETPDGGFAATGYIVDQGFHQRAWLVKANASGDSMWAMTFNKTSITQGSKVLTTQGNGLVLFGADFKLAGDTIASRLPPDLWVLRTTADGDSVWSKSYGNTDDDYPADFVVSGAGYVMAGLTGPVGMGIYDITLTRLDEAGNVQWTKVFGTVGKNDVVQAVVPVLEGGYLLAGSTGTNTFYSKQVYLIRTDTNGDSLWTREFGTTGDDAIYSARQALDGGFVLVGSVDQDMQIIKTDRRGRVAGVVY